jgi:hypothetical protein
MTDETLLAHLAQRLGRGSEDLATEALAYILRNPQAADGMYKHAQRFCGELPPVMRYRTQEWSDDQAIPDLVGVGVDGATPLIVEVKFHAALTSNQPVVYLQRLLPLNRPGLLLFLVPTHRVDSVWASILSRCRDADLALEVDGRMPIGRLGDVSVAVTRWNDLLEDLEHSLVPPTDHRQTLAELNQLRGVSHREDQMAFRPFTSEFLAGDIGQHVLDMYQLIDEVVNDLDADGTVNGGRWTSGVSFRGRYMKIDGWWCHLQVSFSLWGRQRPTPMWLLINDNKVKENQLELASALSPLDSASPSRLLDDNGSPLIPIDLPVNGDRDAVFGAISSQVRDVARYLATYPKPHAEPEPTIQDEDA